MNIKIALIAIVIGFSFSCSSRSEPVNPTATFDVKTAKDEVEDVVQNLLIGIESRDLEKMKSTLSPSGKLELILPGAETTYTIEAFIKLHEGWFADTTWTMETAILSTVIGERVAAVTTSGMYREPERNGQPYFNKMVVSYVLEKQDGIWYVVKDHASSIEKSTD